MNPADPRIGQLVGLRYRITACIGEGGMGTVYRGERIEVGRPVVVKFLHTNFSEHPGARERFDREAKVTAQLNHPNCVSLIDFGVDGNVPYLVIDFVDGQTLYDLLQGGALDARRAVGLTVQILAGLEHAHSRGVFHRDLKPANVMVAKGAGGGDFVKILDFGLAKWSSGAMQFEQEGRVSDLTVQGVALGTPGYMSPEQASGLPTDLRSDIYSTGALLYHMITAKKVFEGDDIYSVLRRHREETPVLSRLVASSAPHSRELEAVLEKATAREQEARYQDASEMMQALFAVPEAEELSIVEWAPHRTGRAIRKVAKRLRKKSTDSRTLEPRVHAAWRWVAVVLLGAALIGGAIRFARRRKSPEKTVVLKATPASTSTAAAVPTPTTAPTATTTKPADADDDSYPPIEVISLGEGEAEQLAPSMAQIKLLIRKGERDDAVRALYLARRKRPENRKAAQIALILGHLHFDRRDGASAIKEYRYAIRLDPDLRLHPVLLANACKLLGDRGAVKSARKLLLDSGRLALPALRKASKRGPETVRKEADRLISQILS